MKIGTRIKARREQLGLSQEELAKRMGYKTRNAIYQYEQVENMKLSLIERFAEVLDCSVGYLTGWEDEEKEKIEKEEEMYKSALLVAYLAQLNEDGFEEALKRLEELTQLSKYRKDNVDDD